LPEQHLYIVKNVCVYIHISGCAQTIWIAFATNNTASEAILHKPGAVRSVDRICIISVPAWRWLGEYVTLDSTGWESSFQAGSNNSPQLLPHLPYRIPRGGLNRKYSNYTMNSLNNYSYNMY